MKEKSLINLLPNKLNELLAQIHQHTKDIINSLIPEAKTFVEDSIMVFRSLVQDVNEFVNERVSNLWDLIKNPGKFIGDMLNDGKVLIEKVGKFGEQISEKFAELSDQAKDVINESIIIPLKDFLDGLFPARENKADPHDELNYQLYDDSNVAFKAVDIEITGSTPITSSDASQII